MIYRTFRDSRFAVGTWRWRPPYRVRYETATIYTIGPFRYIRLRSPV